jgi:hypothetical protein
MKKAALILLLCIMLILSALDKPKIVVFYKQKKPSQQVLAKVDSLLTSYLNSYEIQYLDIEDSNNSSIINKLELPSTHFPFAVVINGKYSAEIEGNTVSFIHFPLFMQGIGRHEGNWSLEDLQKVLESNDLLTEKNVLPILDEEDEESECDD